MKKTRYSALIGVFAILLSMAGFIPSELTVEVILLILGSTLALGASYLYLLFVEEVKMINRETRCKL